MRRNKLLLAPFKLTVGTLTVARADILLAADDTLGLHDICKQIPNPQLGAFVLEVTIDSPANCPVADIPCLGPDRFGLCSHLHWVSEFCLIWTCEPCGQMSK